MNKQLYIILLLFVISIPLRAQDLPVPSKNQLKWQKLETTAFIHFTVNTYTGKEWGDGTERPEIFNPVNFDARKMIKVLKETGFKMAIITAKHHDGFCLWPTAYTAHSVKSSPWKNGEGDMVKEIEQACREYDIQFGFYLSPWDQNHPSYGTSAYNTFYKNQLRELLTNYGEIAEVWFDGAKDKKAIDMEYDFNGYWDIVRELQPNAVMFSDVGPDVRWVGNEKGIAGETMWSTIDVKPENAPGKMSPAYLNVGDPNGKLWIPTETDVSIRPGWFYHEKEDDKVRSAQNLVDLYYTSVGRNSVLLLNIPPNKEGLFAEQDVKNLYEYRSILDETFDRNLAKTDHNGSLTDGALESYISLHTNKPFVVTLSEKVSFDRVSLQENITEGQKNEEALLEYWDGTAWTLLSDLTTIGYKRLLRVPLTTTDKIRITVKKSKSPVQLAELGLYKASARE
ncbi:alpha-L-fucosidase [Sphingobacterium phlebotomi]|uniref:alpha-L-fucosidase n=1 Tax=Sphingobacterium phlebotomi TaxID=2605433 RepID=A0A5D4H8P7_9SPHI|nr:alpha-L-fucosidase [Sphingobacterium phlebotomi]TYR36944.1 alpha-L-fucosidase [Sphingobacterium phlebotomi]